MSMKEDDKSSLLIKDMLLIYKSGHNSSLKIDYDCFDKKYIENNSRILSDTIYKSCQIPKDYFGIIILLKRDMEKDNFHYEHAGVDKGKIRSYKYEIYESNEKEKLFNKIHDDINEIIINKLEIENNSDNIKYKSFYKKENYGKVIIKLDSNEIVFKNNKRDTNIQNFIKSILNYEGFIMRVQIGSI